MSPSVKNLLAMWEIRVQSLGREDPLEKEMTTNSSILAWRIPWIEEPGWLQSMGLQRVGHHRVINTFTFTLHDDAIIGFMVVITLKCIEILNPYAMYQELTQWCPSIKFKNKKPHKLIDKRPDLWLSKAGGGKREN